MNVAAGPWAARPARHGRAMAVGNCHTASLAVRRGHRRRGALRYPWQEVCATNLSWQLKRSFAREGPQLPASPPASNLRNWLSPFSRPNQQQLGFNRFWILHLAVAASFLAALLSWLISLRQVKPVTPTNSLISSLLGTPPTSLPRSIRRAMLGVR